MDSTGASTSGASGSPPEVLEEIQKLFSWNPPLLIHKKKQSLSRQTLTGSKKIAGSRPPGFYDKHFGKEIVLQRVEHFSALPTYLARNVDKSLNAATKLPALRGFITAEQRENEDIISNTIMGDEKEVATNYDKTTAKYCSRVASTLALHPTSSWRSCLLYWTQTGPYSDYAIADGHLCFMELAEGVPNKKDREAIVEKMEPETRQIFETMGKDRLSLATWEMEGLAAAPLEVMNAVRGLGKFTWTYWDALDCSVSKTHVKEKEKVKMLNVGPDALDPPWKLPKISLNTSEEPDTTSLAPHSDAFSTTINKSAKSPGSSMPPSHTKNKGKKRDDDDDDLEASPPRRRPATRSATAALATTSSTKGKGKKREHEEASSTGQRPATRSGTAEKPKLASSAKNKGKKRKRDDDSDYELKDTFYRNAKNMVQQAWAQAVRADGTLIVLHSGNYELVCVRNRGSQTLYVSDVIEPPTYPGYGKLHVGIYIAAVQETIDRKKQLLKISKDGGNPTGGDEDNQDNGGSGSHHKGGGKHHGRRGRGVRGRGVRGQRGRGGSESRFQSSARMFGSTDELVEKTIDLANKYNTILLYIRYDIYDSPIPASFFRSAPSITAHKRSLPPLPPQDIQLEDCMTVVLTSEIGFGSTGVVHRGELTCQQDSTTSLDVAVKLAFNTEQQDALRNEYKVYRYLRSKGVLRGIPTALGFFDDSEGTTCALVTVYAGVPVSTESQGDFSVSDCKSALSTLKCIHHAGILHGDIRRDNILIGDFGITIIDFSHSEQSANQKAKNKELSQLRYILGLASNE